MADYMSDLYRQLAFLQGGGGEESSLDKLNKTFSTLGQQTKNVFDIKKVQSDIAAQAVANKAKELEMKQKGTEHDQLYGQGVDKTAVAGVGGVVSAPKGNSLFQRGKMADASAQEALAEERRRAKPLERRELLVPESEYIKLYQGRKLDPNVDYTTFDDTAKSDRPDLVSQRQDEAARRAVSLVKNYYQSLRTTQGTDDVGLMESLGRGLQSATSKIPITGRAFTPGSSQLNAVRSSMGARLAKAFGDSGNIALQEQKNALNLLAPMGTQNVDIAEQQALTTALEGIKNRSPEEESAYQQLKKSFTSGDETPATTQKPRRLGVDGTRRSSDDIFNSAIQRRMSAASNP